MSTSPPVSKSRTSPVVTSTLNTSSLIATLLIRFWGSVSVEILVIFNDVAVNAPVKLAVVEVKDPSGATLNGADAKVALPR